jgi:hypothetical protein
LAGTETAAAVENTLISAYARLTALPYLDGLGLGAFFEATVQHHTDHLAAFNAAAVRLGGKAQTLPDQPLMTTVVEPGLDNVTSGFGAVMFAARLELISAATCTAQVGTVTDPQLRAAVALVTGDGWTVENVDITVVAEGPRLSPRRAEMQERLGDAVGAPVSVKGKRAEGLGALGRREGIACFAVALLRR